MIAESFTRWDPDSKIVSLPDSADIDGGQIHRREVHTTRWMLSEFRLAANSCDFREHFAYKICLDTRVYRCTCMCVYLQTGGPTVETPTQVGRIRVQSADYKQAARQEMKWEEEEGWRVLLESNGEVYYPAHALRLLCMIM